MSVLIPDDALRVLQPDMVFKVFVGCPKALGFRQDEGQVPFTLGTPSAAAKMTSRTPSMRRRKAIAQSTDTTIVIPSMSGSLATVAIFYGADPGKYAVVDFSRTPSQTVRFGFVFTGPTLIDDKVTDAQNRSAERRLCP